jgi:hypothetical protein
MPPVERRSNCGAPTLPTGSLPVKPAHPWWSGRPLAPLSCGRSGGRVYNRAQTPTRGGELMAKGTGMRKEKKKPKKKK